MKAKTALAALVVSVLLAVGGCAGNQPGQTPGAAQSENVTLWLISGSTPKRMRDFLVQQYAKTNGGVLTIIEKGKSDIFSELAMALPDSLATPDMTEIDAAQASALASSFADISDLYQPFGGGKLFQSFVEAGKLGGENRTLPYYFDSRYVFYRRDIWSAAHLAPPTTLAEFNQAVQTIAELNPEGIPDFSGVYLGGQDWRNALAWVFANGGDLARCENDRWVSTLSDPRTIEGLTQWQQLQLNASHAPATAGDDTTYRYLNDTDSITDEDGNVTKTSLSAAAVILPGAARKSIGAIEKDAIGRSIRTWDDLVFGVFPLPGIDGRPAPVYVGGSNVGVSAKSQHPEGARELLRIIFSTEYQTMLAQNGLGPANSEFMPWLGSDEFALAMIASAVNSKLPPVAPGWAAIEQSGALEKLFQSIAEGADVAALAEQYDDALTPLLNIV